MEETKKPWIIVAQRRFDDLTAIEKAIGQVAPNFEGAAIYVQTAEEVLRAVQESTVRPIVISGQFTEDIYSGDNLARLCKKIDPNTLFLQYSVFEDHGPCTDLAIKKCSEGEHIVIACLIAELTETSTLQEIKEILDIK